VYALIGWVIRWYTASLQLINFAHGEVFMVGAFLALTAIGIFSGYSIRRVVGLLPSVFLFSMAGCALLGALIERSLTALCAVLRNSRRLISSIGFLSFAECRDADLRDKDGTCRAISAPADRGGRR